LLSSSRARTIYMQKQLNYSARAFAPFVPFSPLRQGRGSESLSRRHSRYERPETVYAYCPTCRRGGQLGGCRVCVSGYHEQQGGRQTFRESHDPSADETVNRRCLGAFAFASVLPPASSLRAPLAASARWLENARK
jgi:hypothetical protein